MTMKLTPAQADTLRELAKDGNFGQLTRNCSPTRWWVHGIGMYRDRQIRTLIKLELVRVQKSTDKYGVDTTAIVSDAGRAYLAELDAANG